jgi:ribosomal protein S12 methylthiotransferase accessory factor
VPKAYGSGVHRECAAELTFERVRHFFGQLGITRLADVTGLDRIGIPVYTAIVPRANDVICTYHGKGPTAADARASAVMEVVERWSAGLPLRPAVVAPYDDLTAAGRSALRPDDLNLALLPQYRDDLPIYWVTGHDLLADEPVLVPHSAVSYVDTAGAPPCYALTTSNGLASGNSLEEAICHALCELIERDAMTIAEVAGPWLAEILGGAAPAGECPHVDLDTLPVRVQPLAARFHDAQVELRLVSLTRDLAVPTVMALTSEDGRSHRGYGTHPDAEVALLRAITECAQSRALDDPSESAPGALPSGTGSVAVGDLPSSPSDDVAVDIRLMLDLIHACGLPRVVAVDVSPPEIPVHVVRVLVPGLESWAIDRSKLGTRATRAWNDAAQATVAARP